MCALMVIVYLVQALGPLRINNDGVSYLGLAISMVDGRDLPLSPIAAQYPPGYPLLLAGLDVVGLGSPAGIVLLNLAFLLLAAYSGRWLIRKEYGLSDTVATVYCVGLMSSWVVVKHALLPLSDVPFLGASSASLALLSGAMKRRGRHSKMLFLGGVAMSGIALSFRLAGVALLPAILWSARQTFVHPDRSGAPRWAPWKGTATLLGALLLLGGIGLAFMRPYLPEFRKGYDGGVLRILLGSIQSKLRELGELVLNVPASKFPELVAILTVVGALAIAVALFGLARRVPASSVGDIFVLSYGLLLVLAPWDDARYVLPLAPVVFALVLGEVVRVRRPWRTLFEGAVSIPYSLGAAAAVAYATWMSVSCEAFLGRYGDRSYRESYYAAFKNPPAEGAHGQRLAIEVLTRFRWQGVACRNR